jgi:O-methyltransferase involved in polyketide biosynthesis
MRLTGVSKTAILTLRARADEHRRRDSVFADPKAVEWLSKLEWPRELDFWYTPRVSSFVASRAQEIDDLAGAFAHSAQRASVVELGCGLSTRRHRLAGAISGRWIDLDLPQVIAARESLGDHGAISIARSVLDRSWLGEVRALEGIDVAKTLFIAEGLLYYLQRAEVDALFRDLSRTFAGAAIIFDAIGSADYKGTLRVSSSAGTPVQWMVPPPFDRIWDELGIEPIPGFEPEAMMRAAIARYFRRYGRWTIGFLHGLSRIPALAGLRSGVVYGRLRPLP